MIGYFRIDITEHLLNTKVVVFLEFLWFTPVFWALPILSVVETERLTEYPGTAEEIE